MAELTYLIINGVEIKQLWYGKNKAINESDYNMVYSSYSCENVLTYTESPERDLSGNIRNDDIETFYVPKATFQLSYVNTSVYRLLMELLNQKSFTVKYYDYQLGKNVIRDMYMTESSLNSLHIIGAEIKGFINLTLSFVSRKSYKNYVEMINKNEPTQTLFDLINSGHSYASFNSDSNTLTETISLYNNSPITIEAYSYGGDLETILGNSEVKTIAPHTIGYIIREKTTMLALPSKNPLTSYVRITYNNNSEIRKISVENQTSLE